LTLFKDDQMTKEQTSIFLKWVTDIDVVHDEKYTKFYPHCFAITLSGVTFYYGVESEDDLNWWLEQLTERVAAHHRVAGDEDSESSGAEQNANTNATVGTPKQSATTRNLKKLKQRLGNKKSTSANTGETSTSASNG